MRVSAVVCLVSALVAGGLHAEDSTSDTDWSQWRGPNRDGKIAVSPWPDGLQGHLEESWAMELDPSYSGPLVVENRVVTTETIGKEDERVTVVDLPSGEVIWQQQWPGAMAVPFFAAKNGDWIRATPVSDGNYLVVAGMRDVLKCFRLADGELVWTSDFPTQSGTPLPSFGLVSSPVIDGDALYAQAGAGVRRIDLATGETVWTSLQGQREMTDSAFSSPIVATLAGQLQLVVQTRQTLCGLELSTGNVLWSQPIEAYRDMNILTPLVIGDRIFTSAYGGGSVAVDVSKDADGKWATTIAWDNKAQAYMSSPVLIDGHIYMHLRNRRVVCINAETGETTWTSQPQKEYWSMVASGDKILALDNEGTLILMKANPAEFQIIEESKVAEDTWAHIAVAGKNLLIRDLNKLTRFTWK